MNTAAEVEACLRDGIPLSPHESDVLAQALSERFDEFVSDDPGALVEARRSIGASSPSSTCVQYELRLLGSFDVRANGEPVRLAMNSQRLVTFLALHDGLLLRQHVAGSLWGDTTDRHAMGSLRSALWRLGHVADPLVEVVGPHIRLGPHLNVDLGASETLARRLLDRSADLCETDLDGALLSVDLLPDWTEDWVLVRRDHHTQLRLRALEALSLRLSEMGRFGEAIEAAMMAVGREPLRESAQRTLVAVHLADGNAAAALKQYDAFREMLREELNLEPSEEMQALVGWAGAVTLQ
jgi:DNA-binding SARP family transcriptional activator